MLRVVQFSILAGLLAAGASAAAAQDLAGKTVTLVIGYPPAGGYDTYGRVFARHYGRHLPGRPNVLAQNMPGAGSLVAANALYNTAPKDGTQIGMFASSTALEPAIGNAQAKFETEKFTWIGNMIRDTASCGVWHTSGIRTWEDAVRKGAKFGGSGPSAITSQHALFLKNVLGVPFNVVLGYGGTNDINLAMHRGEVDASCGMYISSVRGSFRNDFESGNLRIIVQFGREDEPFFKGAPNIYKMVKTEADRQLTEFIFGQTEITRPVAAPPGLPAPLVAALRKAFDDTMKDAEFLADAAKTQIDIIPMSGEETAKAFARFAATPRDVIERAKKAVVAQ